MADFVLLYTGGSMPETEAEQARVMQAWIDWYGQIDGSLKDGVPGPQHTGYTIVKADSLESATVIAKGSPVLQGGGSVTVYETLEVM